MSVKCLMLKQSRQKWNQLITLFVEDTSNKITVRQTSVVSWSVATVGVKGLNSRKLVADITVQIHNSFTLLK